MNLHSGQVRCAIATSARLTGHQRAAFTCGQIDGYATAAGASAIGSDMKCPVCKAWVQVKETRQRPDNAILRRYECANGHRFVTNEAVTKVIPIRNANPK
jgi:hypothetical protein